jgi:hypothetical protein
MKKHRPCRDVIENREYFQTVRPQRKAADLAGHAGGPDREFIAHAVYFMFILNGESLRQECIYHTREVLDDGTCR